MRLFKYRPVNEFTRQIIQDDKLYFARPDQFNDPFDCRLDILDDLDRGRLRAEAHAASHMLSVGTYRSIIQGGTHEPYQHLSVREALKLRFVNAYEDQIGLYRELADSVKAIQDAVKAIGIFSMSEIGDDILMFSHYADNHRGIVLEFDVEEGQEPFREIERVRYTCTMPSVTAVNAVELLLLKALQWNYEQEVRALKPTAGTYTYSPEMLKGIVLGAEIRSEEKLLVMAWIKESGKRVKFRQAVKDKRAFKLQLRVMGEEELAIL